MSKESRAASKVFKTKYPETRRNILIWIGRLCIAAFIVFLIFFFVVGVANISGDSMYPTFKDGQQVLYTKLGDTYERGDVAVVKMVDGEEFIKRIIGLPGDTIDIKDGVVYINGEAEEGDYINGETEPDTTVADVQYPLELGEGEYFILGDNRAVSTDSRTFGRVVGLQLRGHIKG